MEGYPVRTISTRKGDISLPVLDVQIVDIEKVQANNYNPNAVSTQNMELLQESILSNGFCFAVVTIWDEDLEKYVIVDGFHRFLIFRDWLQAKEIPIIVLEHNPAQRMAATVQFNRARGVHQVELMGDLVKALVEQGVEMGRPSHIDLHLEIENQQVLRARIGGSAVKIASGSLFL